MKYDKNKEREYENNPDHEAQEDILKEIEREEPGVQRDTGDDSTLKGEVPEVLRLDALLLEERDKYLRLAAEYDNYRKRSMKEREAIFSEIRADTVGRFLSVYDNLARALEQETSDEAYKKGVEMTMTGFKELIEKLGVVEIPAVGEIFNPDVHNAIMHGEDPERGEGEIVQEFQKGFKLGEKVIRFSLVKVVN